MNHRMPWGGSRISTNLRLAHILRANDSENLRCGAGAPSSAHHHYSEGSYSAAELWKGVSTLRFRADKFHDDACSMKPPFQ